MPDDRMREDDTRAWRAATRLIRGARSQTRFGETAEALFLTSSFSHRTAEAAEAAFNEGDEGWIYTRYTNPTILQFEERLRLLEGAEAARATATGMAAVFAALMAAVRAGDRVVASRALFGSCHYVVTELLPRYGVSTALVDGDDLDAWKQALAPGAACVLIETPSNPMLDLVDIRAVSDLAHDAGALMIVDNVFATPISQAPLMHGADIVVYSATKHIDGQGRCLGGIILGGERYVMDELQPFLRNTGPTLSPFNAWVLSKGLETLPIRIARQSATAARLAALFDGHDKVARVVYPGLPSHPQHDLARRQMSDGGTMLAVEIAGGKRGAFAFANALRLVDITTNLGDAKTLLTHPETTTHAKLTPEERAHLGITGGTIRLSIGLEDPEDLVEDFTRALAQV